MTSIFLDIVIPNHYASTFMQFSANTFVKSGLSRLFSSSPEIFGAVDFVLLLQNPIGVPDLFQTASFFLHNFFRKRLFLFFLKQFNPEKPLSQTLHYSSNLHTRTSSLPSLEIINFSNFFY